MEARELELVKTLVSKQGIGQLCIRIHNAGGTVPTRKLIRGGGGASQQYRFLLAGVNAGYIKRERFPQPGKARSRIVNRLTVKGHMLVKLAKSLGMKTRS